MILSKTNLFNLQAELKRSLKIARNTQMEFDHESDYVRVANQEIVINRIEGKLELIDQLLH